MSVIEQERAQASAETRARTRTETLAEILLSQIGAKFDLDEVPEERVAAVRRAPDSDLNRWLIQLLKARTIAEVFR